MFQTRLLLGWLAFTLAAPALAQPQRGDYVVVSRTYGTVYAVDPATGLIRSLVSGLELRDQSHVILGSGPTLSGSFETELARAPSGAILARFALGATDYGLMSIAPATGDRTLLPGTSDPLWDECGVALLLDDGTVLSTADAWDGGHGRVLRYDPTLGATTIISGDEAGDGPALVLPRGLAFLDQNTLLVAEVDMWSAGAGLYRVDVQSGERTFLSRLSQQAFSRQLIVDGQPDGSIMLGDDEGGAGPVTNRQPRSVAVVDGRILVGEAILLPDGSFDGGLLEIDPGTGDRTLLVGRALADDGTGTNVVTVLPENWSQVYLDGPVGLLAAESGRVAFTCLFGPNSIFEFDLETHELFEVASLSPQLDPAYVGSLQLSGLAIWRPSRLRGDLNCDGVVNNFDITPFVKALTDPVLYGQLYPDCDITNGDVNGDELVDNFDITPFVALLAGG